MVLLCPTCEALACDRLDSSPAAAPWCCGLPVRDRSRARALRKPSVTLQKVTPPSAAPLQHNTGNVTDISVRSSSYPNIFSSGQCNQRLTLTPLVHLMARHMTVGVSSPKGTQFYSETTKNIKEEIHTELIT